MSHGAKSKGRVSLIRHSCEESVGFYITLNKQPLKCWEEEEVAFRHHLSFQP